ncbi:MAG: NBR1-Ig-like domain-containing protein [Gammaproteobacteria bacterium]|nr:NBR1-Ig-like domain-containing protein [Gammaproteobacteria bacterium]MDH5731430.1 NBR1-Ig-like domain-containing protein [Gammaproteobacteria bacterium]
MHTIFSFILILTSTLAVLLPNQATAQTPAKFISQVVPENMIAGQQYTVFIQFKNKSAMTWEASQAISLTLRTDKKGNPWQPQHVRLSKQQTVKTDQIATFQFRITAPPEAGEYPFRWQLRHPKLGWIGEKTPNLNISVAPKDANTQAEFVLQKIPGMKKLGTYYTILERGQIYTVSLTFKNNGNDVWTPGKVKLVSKNNKRPLTWMVDQINLDSRKVIKPGEIKTFGFNIVTPPEPGIYDFQWQMFDKQIGHFGEPSEKVAITIR